MKLKKRIASLLLACVMAASLLVVPAGASGDVEITFGPDAVYRQILLGGGILALLGVLAAGVVLAVSRRREEELRASESSGLVLLAALSAGLVASWPGLLAAAATLAVRRFTLIPPGLLAFTLVGIAGAWLARGPWPVGDYAGDSGVLAILLVAALTSLLPGSSRKTKLATATGSVSPSVTSSTGQNPPEK